MQVTENEVLDWEIWSLGSGQLGMAYTEVGALFWPLLFASCLISSQRLLFGNSLIINRNERVLDFGGTAAPL